MSVNKVTLLGNTGKDPDFKTFENGGCVAQFTLATTKRAFTTKDGRQIPERTEWHKQAPPPPAPDAPAPNETDDLPF